MRGKILSNMTLKEIKREGCLNSFCCPTSISSLFKIPLSLIECFQELYGSFVTKAKLETFVSYNFSFLFSKWVGNETFYNNNQKLLQERKREASDIEK